MVLAQTAAAQAVPVAVGRALVQLAAEAVKFKTTAGTAAEAVRWMSNAALAAAGSGSRMHVLLAADRAKPATSLDRLMQLKLHYRV